MLERGALHSAAWHLSIESGYWPIDLQLKKEWFWEELSMPKDLKGTFASGLGYDSSRFTKAIASQSEL